MRDDEAASLSNLLVNVINYDEFAFFNQQLAAMLREGIPLEGALKELSAGMRTGRLKKQILELESDLSRGTPLKDALARRDLPALYIRMVEVGVRANDLPGVLTLLADHYHRANSLWTRLKGLMVYPVVVVLVSLALSLMLSSVVSRFLPEFFERIMPAAQAPMMASAWLPPVLLGALAVLGLAAAFIPGWRARLRWQLPAFREASLAQLGSALALMLKNGMTLPDALALAEALESNSPAGPTLARWRALVESGQGKPGQWTALGRPFPPLFLWLVQKGGENLTAGFQKAAELFHARAAYRIEMALYGALPVSVLLLGLMVFWQVAPLFQSLIWLMNMIGDTGGGGGKD